MRHLLSPIAIIAILVSVTPLSPPAAPVVALDDAALRAVHAGGDGRSSALPTMAIGEPVRGLTGEQIDVWMSEQGVAMILDAARPVPGLLPSVRR